MCVSVLKSSLVSKMDHHPHLFLVLRRTFGHRGARIQSMRLPPVRTVGKCGAVLTCLTLVLVCHSVTTLKSRPGSRSSNWKTFSGSNQPTFSARSRGGTRQALPLPSNTSRNPEDRREEVWAREKPQIVHEADMGTNTVLTMTANGDSTNQGGAALLVEHASPGTDERHHDAPEIDVQETNMIQPIEFPFLQKPEEWLTGHGISLKATGEPKSGTTWIGRLVPQLALELCGSEENQWCRMGGLVVTPNIPAPRYEFEMLDVSVRGSVFKPRLFLHFKGDNKHLIPGMDTEKEHGTCHNGGRYHLNFFADDYPCDTGEAPTRESLNACLWNTSADCLPYMTSLDPNVRRTVVVLRDPRNVVLSERRMRVNYYNADWVKSLSVEEFIEKRFEVLVSWMHQRWQWHTSDPLRPSSHVVIYEDLKDSPAPLIGIADFMGLKCNSTQALRVWNEHRSKAVHGDFTNAGLGGQILEWMNATMARLLPIPLVRRWGLTPTDV